MANERFTFEIYPGPDNADFLWHEDDAGRWGNKTGVTIYLKELRWWVGASRGLIADINGVLTLSRSNTDITTLHGIAVDRYDPVEGHYEMEPLIYTPDYVTINPDEWLTLKRKAAPLFPMEHAQVLQVVRGWYTKQP